MVNNVISGICNGDVLQATVSEVLTGARYNSGFCYLQGRQFTDVWRRDHKAAAGFASVCFTDTLLLFL